MRFLPSGLIAIVLAVFVIALPSKILAATFAFPSFSFPIFSRPTPPTPPVFNAPKVSVKPSESPKVTPNSTPKVSISPTSRATESPTPKPTTSAKVSTSPIPTTTSVKDFIMTQINDYRKSHGLSAVKTDPYTCAFAAIRAKEVVNNFNHDGFRNRLNSKTLPYPKYSKVTENLAFNSNYKNVVSKWIGSSGHAANMRADTPYVCVEAYNNYYAYEGWKP